jgi:hypothetical protein
MVAKIFRSTSFLITRFDLIPSFSDSSLTVMPSPMVISRSMGGGGAGLFAANGSLPDLAFHVPLAIAARTLAGTECLPPCIGGRRSRGLDPHGRGGMQRPSRPGTSRTSILIALRAARRRSAGSAHQRLARTNGAAIDRLAGNGAGRRTRGNAGTRLRGLRLSGQRPALNAGH